MSYQVTEQSDTMMRIKISRLFRCLSLLIGIIILLWLGFNARFILQDRRGETLRFANDERGHSRLSHKGNEAKSRDEESRSKNMGILAQQSWRPFSAKHDYPYLLNDRFKCVNKATKMYEKLTVIAIVASDPANHDRRNVIRMTWVRHAIKHKYAIKVLFILGETSDRIARNKIKHEALLHNDIIQEAFQDSYMNLTVKTIGALKWATKLCPRSEFFMKLDDDVVVNVGNLTGFLDFSVPSVNYLGGMVQVGAVAMRNPEEKWYTPVEIYPEATYPPYPEGKIYIMSMDVAKKIYEHSRTINIFPWEDIFIGMCAKQLGIVPQDIQNFHGVWKVMSAGTGLIKNDETLANLNLLYVFYDLDIGQMIEVWQAWIRNSWD